MLPRKGTIKLNHYVLHIVVGVVGYPGNPALIGKVLPVVGGIVHCGILVITQRMHTIRTLSRKCVYYICNKK